MKAQQIECPFCGSVNTEKVCIRTDGLITYYCDDCEEEFEDDDDEDEE